MKIKCCICGKEIEDTYSNNAWPITKGKCCNKCNEQYVIPARIERILENGKQN